MKITQDMLVEFTYSITDANKQLIERIDQPANYIHGRHSGMHDKIVKAMEGRREGDILNVTLAPDEGFGPRDPNLVVVEKLSNVPPDIRRVGAEAQFHNDRGELKTFRVTDISNGQVTLDGNHPLAGQPITFSIRILTVRPATPAELSGQTPTGIAPAAPNDDPPTLN